MQALQSSELTRELLDEEKISIVPRFLSNQECNDLIKKAEESGFNKSAPSGGGHGRTGREEPRDNKYTVITDQSLADCYWSRVKRLIPEDLSFIEKSPYFGASGGSEWKACGLVERFRFYRYDVGEHYPEHMDGCYKRTVIDATGETFQQQSFLTLLIYLNDDFEGGNTQYYPSKQHCRFLRDIENKIPTTVVTPRKGSALISQHSLLHEGCPVDRGTKYVLRTDILYSRRLSTHKKIEKFQTQSAPSVSEWTKIFEPSCKTYHD